MPTTLAPPGARSLSDARAADRLHRLRTYERRIASCELGAGLLILGITLCLATCTLKVYHSASLQDVGGVVGGIAVGAASLLLDALRRRVEAIQRGWNDKLNQEQSVNADGGALNLPARATPTPSVPAATPTQLADLRTEIRFLSLLRLGAAAVLGALWAGV